VDAAEAQAQLDKILDESQRQPIAIQREGQGVAVMLSVASYERLRAGDIERFLDRRREVATEAAANGLTEEERTKILNDQ
jgi:prevent-host-death family protein